MTSLSPLLSLLVIAGMLGMPVQTWGASSRSPGSPAPASRTETERGTILQLIQNLGGGRAAQRDARERLIAIGKRAVPALIDALQSEVFSIRWGAVNVLGDIQDAAAQPHLLQRVLHDPNNHVRWRAIWALNRVRSATVLSDLHAALQSSDRTTQWNAAVALSTMHAMDAVPVLRAGLRESSPWTLWEAINALGRVYDDHTVDALLPFLKHPAVRIRQETVLSLGKIATEQAIVALINVLSDAYAGVRWRAAMVLAQTGDKRVVAPLEEALRKETDPFVKTEFKKALDELQSK